MTSPLLPRANSYLLLQAGGTPTVVEGRVVTGPTEKYLVHCYLRRQDSKGTDTGSRAYPAKGAPGSTLPGTSGTVSLYRGYGLRYVKVADDYALGTTRPPTSGYKDLLSTSLPAWLSAGVECLLKQGAEPVKHAVIESCTGQYGGTDIDEVISINVGGIPLVITAGSLMN